MTGDPAQLVSNPSPIDRLSRALGDRLAWLFLISAGLTCLEVLLDWIFRSPTIWVHDTTIMMSATCFLFGGAYALERRDHIRITFLYDMMSPRIRHWCDRLTLTLTLVYLGALLWFVTKQAWQSIKLVEMSGRAWDFPMPMVIRIAFFFGTLLLLLQALAHWIDAIIADRKVDDRERLP
ncbi:MAG: TRAP transporter small permease subunit [Alphaproteobacteria bacterium]|nr:TRAP transporter small permease subunit [Alphaproteobacteria bacterium]